MSEFYNIFKAISLVLINQGNKSGLTGQNLWILINNMIIDDFFEYGKKIEKNFFNEK